MWRLVSKNFLNARRIFPTKQRHVADMVEICRKDENVRRAIVFGSSVTAACNPWSDIDIYFELDKEKPNIKNYRLALRKVDQIMQLADDLLVKIEKLHENDSEENES